MNLTLWGSFLFYTYNLTNMKEVTISTLATKIKITVKEYQVEKSGRNVRVGFGRKGNMRVYMNAKNPTKKVLVNTEHYDIRKQDD